MGELQQVTNLFDMTTDYKVTELFCIIDEFCKHFEAEKITIISGQRIFPVGGEDGGV